MGWTVGDVINDHIKQNVESRARKKCDSYCQAFEDCQRTLNRTGEKDHSKCQFYKDMLYECRKQAAISVKHHQKIEVYYDV